MGEVSSRSWLPIYYFPIDHFAVVCLVAWPLNESEAGVDLVLIATLLLFICKFLLTNMRTAFREVSIKTRSPLASVSFKGQATKQETVKLSIVHNALGLPPKFCINYCCEILLGGLHVPKSILQQ